jgi:DNA-binding NarL/FixJ family response regulator
MNPIRLLLIDDHRDVRQALALRLSMEADLTVVDVPASSPEAVGDAMNDAPDVVLLDINKTGGDGLAFCRRLKNNYPGSRIVALSAIETGRECEALTHMGISTHLFKDLDISDLLGAIRRRDSS